jgi:hypothetical protein
MECSQTALLKISVLTLYTHQMLHLFIIKNTRNYERQQILIAVRDPEA